jgi:hypothetical protein
VLSPLSPLFKVFSPPAGQTCTDWASQYIAAAGGYLNDASAQAVVNCQLWFVFSSFLDSRQLRD